MFDAIMSDNGRFVILFYKDKEEPEVMTIYDYVVAYGNEILKEGKIKGVSNNSFDGEFISATHYYDLFERLVNISGKYSHTVKWLNNVMDEKPNAIIEAREYFKTDNPVQKLEDLAKERDEYRKNAMKNFNKYINSINKKPLNAKETEILLERLFICDARYRRKVRNCIEKYSKKGEIKSPAEIFKEIDERKTKKPSK